MSVSLEEISIFSNFIHVCSQHGSVCPLTHFVKSDARGCPPLADVFILLGGKEKIPAPVLGGFTAYPWDQ